LKALAQKGARTRWLTERIASLISAGRFEIKTNENAGSIQGLQNEFETVRRNRPKTEEGSVFFCGQVP
jgi:hypothetical protein